MAAADPNPERSTPGAGFSDLLSTVDTKVLRSSRVDVPPINSLEDLDIDEALIRNVAGRFNRLTPVQRYAIPASFRNINVLSCSYTGSGKTAAFLLPVLNNVLKVRETKVRRGLPAQPLVLILAPTRELAKQIKEEAVYYCRCTALTDSIHLVCGGKNMEEERIRLSNKAWNVVVATVGRLMDLLFQKLIDLGQVKYFVLDEADEMMDKGFFFDVINLSKMCSASCVSSMFSATFPNAVRKVAESILGSSFVEIQVGEDGPAASKTINQELEIVERAEKDYLLKNCLDSRASTEKILIFGSSIPEVERIHQFLINNGFTAGILHSALESQQQREFALNEFKRKKVRILVATSVAARGLDIPNVDLVINYDMPSDIEEYILRIGRTGRVGNKGDSLSFFEIERDAPIADKIISCLRRSDQIIPEWLCDVKAKFEEDETRLYEAHGIGELGNKKRVFNAYGSSLAGVPCSNEVDDDTWD